MTGPVTRTTEDLNDVEGWPLDDGVDEIVIRVSRWTYDSAGRPDKPGAYQAIVRGVDKRKPYGCSIMGNPITAIQRAINDWYGHQSPAHPVAEAQAAEDCADQEIEDLLG